MAKLTELTPRRQQIINDAYTEYLSVGLSTEPADFDAAEKSITSLYASIGKPAPYFVRLSSPLACQLYINLYNSLFKKEDQLGDQLWDQLGDQLRGQLRGQLWDQLGGQLRDQLRGQLGDQLWDQRLQFTSLLFSAQFDYYWMYLEVGGRLGVIYDDKENVALNDHITVCRSIGMWHPFESVCVLSDRPSAIRFDDQNRLHAEDKMALEYRDGTGFYSWHGTRVPDDWLTGSPPTAAEALRWDNTEQRRAACEIIGWHNVLDQLNARTIQADDNPLIGTLLEADIPDIGRERFLKVQCGTGRTFALPVPPDMTTALQAQAWINQVPESIIQSLEVRT